MPTATPTPCAPANDNFENAEGVTQQPFTTSTSTTCATWQKGERTCGNNGYYSVWYAYTPSQTGTVQVDTFGTDFDTSLAVYTGDALGSLSQLACVDDAWPSDLSAVRFKALAGQTYFIQAAEGYERGDLTLSIGPIRPVPPPFTATPTWTPCPTPKIRTNFHECGTVTPTFTPTSTPTPCPAGKVPYYMRCFTPTPTNTPCFAPANDDVGNAVQITSIPFTMSGSAHCATEQPGESAWSCGYEKSVWFRFTATSSETLRASLTGKQHLEGNVFAGTKPIRCLDAWSGAAEQVFDTVDGVTYYFQISAERYADGAYTFTLDVAPPPTPTRTPCPTGADLNYEGNGQYSCITPTPTRTPCPADKVLGYDYNGGYYHEYCGTPTPTFTPCPTEKIHDYSRVCGTATPTTTPCPTGKEVLKDNLYFPEQRRCGTATPTFTPCPAGATPNYNYGGGCVTPTYTPTPCPTGKVLSYNYDLHRYDSCGTPTPTYTPTFTPTPCPAEKVLFYQGSPYYGLRCGTPTPTYTPTATCPAGKGSTFFGCIALPTDRSFLYVNDDYGNWWLYTDANVDFSSARLGEGLFSLDLGSWEVRFRAPNGQLLQPGTYSDATQWYSQPGYLPAMNVSPYWARCEGQDGSFTVESVEFRADHIESFRVSFEQHCTLGISGLRGVVQIRNVPQPTATPTRTPPFTPTPCPAGKVPSYPGCGTPTPTFPNCPTETPALAGLVLTATGTPCQIPVRTPCPYGKVPSSGGCGTPTPCPTGQIRMSYESYCGTPELNPDGNPELDFSIGIDSDGDGEDDCGSGPDESGTCNLSGHSTFTVRAYLDRIPSDFEYAGFATQLAYYGVTPKGKPDPSPWPPCAYAANASGESFVNGACVVGVGESSTAYTGLLTTTQFTCTADGTIWMQHQIGETLLTDYSISELRERGPDNLTIDCGLPSGTPTATPTAGPNSQNTTPGMALQVYGDTAKEQVACGKGALERACDVGDGAFSVDVHTDAGPSGGFLGYQAVLQYSGAITLVDQGGLNENRWPRCAGPGLEQLAPPAVAAPGRYTLGCAAEVSSTALTYEGVLANVHFACRGSGTGLISLIGGAGASVSFYHRPSINGNRIFLASEGSAGQQLADSVVVECGSASVGLAGVDTDGDGCADERETGANERQGGRRDALNPWDFFEPTGDKKHRIDDILRIVGSYLVDDGSAAYTMASDRTVLGPNLWNLGPPNGQVRIDDVLTQVRLYFHDCT